jgi:hypothetical protein
MLTPWLLENMAQFDANGGSNRDSRASVPDHLEPLRYSQEFLQSPQFFFSTKPVHFGDSQRAPSLYPECVSESRNVLLVARFYDDVLSRRMERLGTGHNGHL